MWWPTAEWGECQVKSSLRICLNLRLKESCPCLVLVPRLKPISNQVKHFYRTQVDQRSDLWVRMSVTPPPLWNLTDVMLANEDTNSIPTDNANRAIQGNACNPTWWPTCETMLVAHDQIFNQSKLCHQVAKFATIMQVVPCCCQI